MKKTILVSSIAISLFACTQAQKLSDNMGASNPLDTTYQVQTGGSGMIQVDGKYNVWAKKTGEDKIKVLLLHGGPGFSHDYFECFEDFLPKEGIGFYYL